jgi:hypothetical protein
VAWMRLATGVINGGTKGVHQGGGLSNHQRRLQAMGGPYDPRV